MNLLQIAQAIARETKEQETPIQIIGSSKSFDKQVLEAITLSITALARNYDWQELQKEYTFNSVASTESYTLPSGYDRMINSTFWNATEQREIISTITPQEWRLLKNSTIGGGSGFPEYARIRGNNLLLYPTPTAINSYVFEYISKNTIISSGDVEQTTWIADTDTPIIDDYILRLDTTWRVLAMQGKHYAEVKAQTDFEITNKFAMNTPKRTITLCHNRYYSKIAYPQIITP